MVITAAPTPDRLAGYEDVAAAWRKALRAQGDGPAFSVGVCNPSRRVVCGAVFDSFEQVQKFSREMTKLGYAALIIGTAEEMQGCDVIYVRQSDARDIFDGG